MIVDEKIIVHGKIMGVLCKLPPDMIRQVQGEYVDISKVMCYVKSYRKTGLLQICKIKSRQLSRYPLHFD